MKEAIKTKVVRHGEDVIKLFNLDKDTNPLQLCRKLRRLETEGERVAVDYCNGDIDEEAYLKLESALMSKVDKVLNFRKQCIPVFLNGDPRGYALKISDKWLRETNNLSFYRDMGGYGIIAPDLSEV